MAESPSTLPDTSFSIRNTDINHKRSSSTKSYMNLPAPPVPVMEEANVIAFFNPLDKVTALVLSKLESPENDQTIKRNV